MVITEYRVNEIIEESHDTRTLKITPVEGGIFDFKPGQFVMLYLKNQEGEFKESRAYSIASSPTRKDCLNITYKKAGYFTGKLFDLKEGDIIGVKGPYGRFKYDEEHKDVVLLAGGVGITPFKSYLEYVTDKKLPNKIALIFSNKTETDILYRKELESLDNGNNVRVFFTITREDWDGRQGRINADCVKDCCGDNYSEKTYFICGTNDFVKAMTSLLEEMNVPKDNIKIESFGG